MTQDEIIEMVKQAGGFEVDENDPQCSIGKIAFDLEELVAFAKLVAAKAIAELESQEPVATVSRNQDESLTFMPLYDFYVTNGMKLYAAPQQRTWVDLTEEELRLAFGKLYPNDIGLLELAENNKDYAVEAIGARHHWTAFKAGARAGEAKLKEKNI
jgi:hypothetical protein